jgi:hypothetical protein
MSRPVTLGRAATVASVALVLLPVAMPVLTADDHYVCTISVEYALTQDGRLQQSNWSERVKGQRFVVDRLTGSIRGNFITTAGADNVKVVDRGSSQNSYKSYWTHPRLASAPLGYLEIRTFEGAKPPFLVVNNSGTYTGICD